MAFYRKIGNNYAQAIRKSGVKRVVHLSSVGAHLDKSSGTILGHHSVEEILKALPGIATTHMRPNYFYYNLNSYVNMIKKAGFIAANFGGDEKLAMVSPIDIAAAIANEIVTPLVGRKIRYVASDERTCTEIASILGEAIGKPELKWNIITKEQTLNGLVAIGMSPTIAPLLVDMYECLHNGTLAESYYLNKPAVMGKIKLEDFAKDFATTYNK